MNATAAAVQNPDSFAAMFEESLTRKEMRAGELITAQVVRVDHNVVVVNAGLKSESLIPVEEFLDAKGYPYRELAPGEWAAEVARLIAEENVVGLLQGRMEFGPRALGNRSIVGDARSPRMQSIMNLKIKYRESFRPFAPSVLEERIGDFFDLDRPSPYMLLVAPVKESRRIPLSKEDSGKFGLDLLNVPKSDVPAVTHVDYSARIQTVDAARNPLLHRLLRTFERQHGCGVLVNTSFNVRGEPIVCAPEDAYRCFMFTHMDVLVMGPHMLRKIA